MLKRPYAYNKDELSTPPSDSGKKNVEEDSWSGQSGNKKTAWVETSPKGNVVNFYSERNSYDIDSVTSTGGNSWGWFGALVLLIVLTVLDTVLCAALFFEYTSTYAQFINQGTALVYGISSTLYVVISSKIKRAKENHDYNESFLYGNNEAPAKWYHLLIIGMLNGSGNFCMAMGQPHTLGTTQALLNLLTVPLVMFMSWLFLKHKTTLLSITGAILIIIGAGFSAMHSDNSQQFFWYSSVLYAGGQVFIASERVFEENVFTRHRSLDVMVMFMWTMWTQFLLGWALYPLQTLPALGGLVLSDIPAVIWDGVLCTAGITSAGIDRPECTWVNPVLFFTYCTVDLCCYAWGLYVIQKGGANLMVIASAVSLPVIQCVWMLPFMQFNGKVDFLWSDGVALVCVLMGFGICEFLSEEGKERQRRGITDQSFSSDDTDF